MSTSAATNRSTPPRAAPSPRALRCAVYTRKSSEHNLDLAFTSLDAQREACEAYVTSQSHEGWRCLPDRFDDGGLSGASLERPALQRLLDVVRAGQIDIVVVYKVDRLTRSLADFAKLVELFDAHGVSFVSITQAFNTTTSMGRLTLNVLLSFAQFEREVIGERVRDKIAASKRKGLWTGGGVPFGYRVEAKTLVPEPVEAEAVRTIFARYRTLDSIGALIEDLAGRGLAPRPSRSRAGIVVQRARFGVGPLAYLLANRVYVGEAPHRGAAYPGVHEAIVGRELFDAVQAQLAANAVARRVARRDRPYLLSGLLFDDRGHAMSPSHACKGGVRYRYYVSQALLQGRKAEAGSVPRVPAPEIERLIVDAVRACEQRGTGSEIDGDGFAHDLASDRDRDRVAAHVRRIVVRLGAIELDLNQEGDGPKHLTIPWTKAPIVRVKGVRDARDGAPSLDARTRSNLLVAIAKARRWVDDLVIGRTASIAAIAAKEGIGERYAIRLLRLACLSPRIVRAIVDGTAPADTTVSSLTEPLPLAWAEQERRVLKS